MSNAAEHSGLHFYTIKEAEKHLLPYGGSVKAGFPSPAENFVEGDIDLVEYLGMNKQNIEAIKVNGNYLLDDHAPDGSYLICDTSLMPISQDLAIIILNGEFLVKQLVKAASGWVLYSGNTHKNPTIIGEGDDFRIWGVVVQIILQTRQKAKAGPAGLGIQEGLDLVALLNMHKPSVYVVRTDGNSMRDQHVIDKSYLIVDRSLRPQAHDIVVAVLNGGFTIKSLVPSSDGWVLYPGNPIYPPIPIKEEDDFKVWGVVAHIIIDRKEMRKRYG